MLATQQRGTGSGQAMERRASLRNGPGALSTSNGGGQDDVDDLERLARPILTRRKGAQWPGVMNNHRRALAAGWGPQLPHEVLAACAVWHAAVAVGGRGVPGMHSGSSHCCMCCWLADFIDKEEEARKSPNRVLYFRRNADYDRLIEVCSRKLSENPRNIRALLIRASSNLKKGEYVISCCPESGSAAVLSHMPAQLSPHANRCCCCTI